MFKFEFMNLDGISLYKRSVKFSIAMNKAEKCLNSPEFSEFFLNKDFTQLGEFSGRDKKDLLNLLLRPVYCDYYVIPRPWYKRFSSVIGWTAFTKKFLFSIGWKSIAQVSTYVDQFDAMSVAGLAGHLVHEIACHGNGFSHSYKWVKERDDSIPYSVGNYVESWVSKSNNNP